MFNKKEKGRLGFQLPTENEVVQWMKDAQPNEFAEDADDYSYNDEFFNKAPWEEEDSVSDKKSKSPFTEGWATLMQSNPKHSELALSDAELDG